jgi:hypothetical protein
MTASVNISKEECLIEITRLLDASFDDDSGPLVLGIRQLISILKNNLALEKTEEVAQLVLNNNSEESIKDLLERNFPSGVSIRNVEEILKLVYVGTDTKNLKKAINFVQIFDYCHQVQAFNALYEDVKFKEHTEEPEMLLMQKKIRQLQEHGQVLDDTRKQVDEDCRKIIGRIVREIEDRNYPLSIYCANELERTLLSANMETIVQEFYNGTLENTLLLIEYSTKLPRTSIKCFLIDALLKELEKSKLLDSENSMHLWAHAKYTQEHPVWLMVETSCQKLCTDAVEKMTLNKEQLLRHYQKYVENDDKQKIINLHLSNRHLHSIVGDFVSFYYNGDVGRTQNLLAVANASAGCFSDIEQIVVWQLYNEMVKHNHLASFGAFRLFHMFHKIVIFNPSGNSERMQNKAPEWVRQLLWPEGATEFQLVNKFFNAALSVENDNNNVVCFALGDKQSNQTWRITFDQETALLTLTHAQKELELGAGNNASPCLAQTGEGWMVKAVDEYHLKIYRSSKGKIFVPIIHFEIF